MKKNLLYILAILLTLTSCSSKFSFFENYDLSSGKYKVLVFADEGDWIENYRNFYIDDIETLIKMKKQWVFNQKSEVMPCGYGYNIYLVDEDTILKNISVNIDCEYMTGWWKFPKEYLTKHKSSFKVMSEKELSEFHLKYFDR